MRNYLKLLYSGGVYRSVKVILPRVLGGERGRVVRSRRHGQKPPSLPKGRSSPTLFPKQSTLGP